METNLESVAVIFPNQLFKSSTLLDNSKEIFLIEELLYFKYFNFHKQKIAFHRSSMQKYKNYLSSKNIKVHYVESFEKNSDIRLFLSSLNKSGYKKINIYNPIDDWLFKRISNFKGSIKLKVFQNPLFINDHSDLNKFFRTDKNKFSHSVFYKQQRKKFSILMDIDNKPIGGKFSFDSENRKKYPTKKTPPLINHHPMIGFGLKLLNILINIFIIIMVRFHQNSIIQMTIHNLKDGLINSLLKDLKNLETMKMLL